MNFSFTFVRLSGYITVVPANIKAARSQCYTKCWFWKGNNQETVSFETANKLSKNDKWKWLLQWVANSLPIKAIYLLIICSSGILLNLISNIPMVVIIFKTSRFNIISTYLTLNLALGDIFKSSFQIFGIIPTLCLMMNRSSCTSEIIFNVIRHFLFILSKCFVALISDDRYQHVKGPNRYTQIMTFKKVKRFQMAIGCNCVIHSWCLISQFYILEVDNTFACGDSFTNNCNCSWLFIYIRSIQLLNQHSLRSQKFSRNTTDLAKHAKHIIVYAFFYFIALGVTIFNMVLQRKYRYFFYWLKQVYANFYPRMNAICFFCINRERE